MQVAELAEQVLAAPEDQRAEQQQRQKHQRSLQQRRAQLAQHHAPGQAVELLLQAPRGTFQPLEIQRLVAGNPEHLLVDGGAQVAGGAVQFALIELQGDRLVEQGVERATQALEQLAARFQLIEQGIAQLRGDVLARLALQQVVDITRRIADLVALLVQVELIQADIGDLVGQPAVFQLQLRQRLFLLIEDARQQQAALQHPDLLVQGLVGLVEVVQLLAGSQVLLGQAVEAVGGAQQVIGQFEVERTFPSQQAVGAGTLGLARLLGDGLLRLGAAAFVDQALQLLALQLGAADALLEQRALGAAEVQQLAVAGHFLAAQLGLRGELGELGVEQGAPFRRQRLAVVPAAFQAVVDLLAARLVLADLGLGALGAGLRGDHQAIGLDDRLVPFG